MQTQISPSFKISYRQEGQGAPLVFLHAFPLSSAMWNAQFEEFTREWTVLAPDFRGIGETSAFEKEPSVQTLAADVAIWLDHLGVNEKIVLCGLSMGGYTALEFARSHGDRLAALILADTDSEETSQSREEMIQFAKTSDGRAVAQKMLPKLVGETTLRDNPRIAEQIQQLAAPNTGENLAKLIAALRDRRDSASVLPQIAVPTLVIGGSEDAVSPPDVMAQMAAQIPHARHVVIEGAGHLAGLEKPAAFNRELRAFLHQI
ncbi:MAG: alpha/beta hydrolase [Armatimonadetes bacterium]|nr:alpha/beta hydrolase [Armatimonadota bacterium]